MRSYQILLTTNIWGSVIGLDWIGDPHPSICPRQSKKILDMNHSSAGVLKAKTALLGSEFKITPKFCSGGDIIIEAKVQLKMTMMGSAC